jgi:hypothetical protein
MTAIEEENFVEKKVQRKTSRYASIYEYSAIVAAHTLKLTSKKVLPELDPAFFDYNMMNLAEAEVDAKKVHLAIRRHLSDGTTEDWYAHELIFPPK